MRAIEAPTSGGAFLVAFGARKAESAFTGAVHGIANATDGVASAMLGTAIAPEALGTALLAVESAAAGVALEAGASHWIAAFSIVAIGFALG